MIFSVKTWKGVLAKSTEKVGKLLMKKSPSELSKESFKNTWLKDSLWVIFHLPVEKKMMVRLVM